jgi:hypothetical protein
MQTALASQVPPTQGAAQLWITVVFAEAPRDPGVPVLDIEPGELPPAPPGPEVSRKPEVRKVLVPDNPPRVTL